MSDPLMHTRDKIVELGRDYIQQGGYQAFNYRQIATALNIKSAAVHHYYPSKVDLGLAVVLKDQSDFKRVTESITARAPLERLQVIIDTYTRYFKDGHKLCIIGTFESEIHNIPEKIQVATTTYLNDIYKWVKATMQEGLDKGEFNFKQSAADMAELWIAGLPASLMTGRLRGEHAFNAVIRQLTHNLILN